MAKWSIIMLCWNACVRTAHSINSVKQAIEHYDGEVQFITIDNGSTDADIVNWLPLQTGIELHRLEKNIGVPRGRNKGLDLAIYDNILFLDNDIELKPNALPRMTEELLNPQTGMTGDAGGLFVPGWIDLNIWGHDTPSGDYPNTNFIVGYCMATRKDVVQTVGRFDEEFPPFYCEDIDYGIRVRQAGYALSVAADICYHYGHSAVSKLGTASVGAVEREGQSRLLMKHSGNCPRWALILAEPGTTTETIQKIESELPGEQWWLHVISPDLSIPPCLPKRMVFPAEKYGRMGYSVVCNASTSAYNIGEVVMPQRDDAITVISSPKFRRPW